MVASYNDCISKYKKLLAGKLLAIQERIFNYQHILDNSDLSVINLDEIVQFLNTVFAYKINSDDYKGNPSTMLKKLKSCLHKPIRVCGMVKNQGEPGGGPFWVLDNQNQASLQIVEAAQINTQDQQQHNQLKRATHFNPVDIVCGVKNYKGEKFDLKSFVDSDAVFISNKTKNGTALKALELPGLWNGAMARWNTLFVEVPLDTFNPVKTVNDLLKKGHQETV